MGCQPTKCSTPGCNKTAKSCKLINGKCPSCYEKSKQPQNPKQ